MNPKLLTAALLLAAFSSSTDSSWFPLGGSATDGVNSGTLGNDWGEKPALALAPGGNPVVAWTEWFPDPYNYEIYVRQWDGAEWVDLGESATGGGISATPDESWSPALAVDRNGNPVVAWSDYWDRDIYLKRWNGSSWAGLGGSAFGGGISDSALLSLGFATYPALALDPDDNPVVAWVSDEDVYLKRWNPEAGAWEGVGGSAALGGISASGLLNVNLPISLAVDSSGDLLVAWSAGLESTYSPHEIYVCRWDGLAWSGLDGTDAGRRVTVTEGNSRQPSMAVDSLGLPTVAWSEDVAGNLEVHVRQWKGQAWVELGGSATAGGVSATGDDSYAPSLALDASGIPTIAWSDKTGGNYQIYLRRWDESDGIWTEVGGASASAGGLSDSTTWAGSPSVAVDGSGEPVVAWSEGSASTAGTVVRLLSRSVDRIPPARVTDLQVSSPSASTLRVSWTAPGDDGAVGRALEYDIRVSETAPAGSGAAELDAWWAGATPLPPSPMPVSGPAAQPEMAVAPGLLPGLTYYFALRTVDASSNWSLLSNVASGVPSAPSPDDGGSGGHGGGGCAAGGSGGAVAAILAALSTRPRNLVAHVPGSIGLRNRSATNGASRRIVTR